MGLVLRFLIKRVYKDTLFEPFEPLKFSGHTVSFMVYNSRLLFKKELILLKWVMQ